MNVPKLSTTDPRIISALISTGVVSTAFLSGRAAIKMEHILNQLPDEDASIWFKARATWKAWTPPLAVALATISLTIAGTCTAANKIAVSTTAAANASSLLADYKDEVRKVISSDDYERVEKTVREKHRPEPPQGKLPVVGQGGQLVYDSLSGRYFTSDLETIRSRVNDFNQSLIGGTFATVNEWYAYLGLPPVTLGGSLGWSSDRLMDIIFDSMVSDGQAVLVLDYLTRPTNDYR